MKQPEDRDTLQSKAVRDQGHQTSEQAEAMDGPGTGVHCWNGVQAAAFHTELHPPQWPCARQDLALPLNCDIQGFQQP